MLAIRFPLTNIVKRIGCFPEHLLYSQNNIHLRNLALSTKKIVTEVYRTRPALVDNFCSNLCARKAVIKFRSFN